MSVFLLCERAIGFVRGKRLTLSANEKSMLEALDYDGLANAHAQDEAVTCARHFEFVRDRLLQLWPWTFARNTASLTSTGTEAGWSKAYSLPGDCLSVLAVLSNGEPVEWEEAAGKLLCNAASVSIRYTAKVTNTNKWAPAFEDAFCAALASEIAAAVMGDPNAIQLMEQRAQLSIQRAWQIGAIQPETRIPLKDELCNRAIGLIRGQRLPASTSAVAQEGGADYAGLLNIRQQEETAACKRAFDSVRDRLLSLHPWVFARKTAAPAKLTASVTGWKYAYALPSGCLKTLNVIYRDKVLAHFEITDKLLCNHDPIEIRYTARITDTAKWSPEFTDAFCAALASEVEMAVTGRADIAAALEQKSQAIIQQAYMNGAIRSPSGLQVRSNHWLDYSGLRSEFDGECGYS